MEHQGRKPEKKSEIINEHRRRGTEILVVSEIKKKTKGIEEIDDCMSIYFGVRKENGVTACLGLILRKEIKSRVTGYS
jgi:hypothetical protein